jgi:hypothetical protein
MASAVEARHHGHEGAVSSPVRATAPKEGNPMIHMSGTFDYQPRARVEAGRPGFGIPETQPAAIYLGIMLRNDDGTPVFANDDDLDIVAVVTMSRPQQLLGQVGPGVLLNLNLDFINFGYLGFTAQIDLEEFGLADNWTPLGVLVFVHGLPVGVLTAAPCPIADTGIAPPELQVFE